MVTYSFSMHLDSTHSSGLWTARLLEKWSGNYFHFRVLFTVLLWKCNLSKISLIVWYLKTKCNWLCGVYFSYYSQFTKKYLDIMLNWDVKVTTKSLFFLFFKPFALLYWGKCKGSFCSGPVDCACWNSSHAVWVINRPYEPLGAKTAFNSGYRLCQVQM